MPIMTRTSGGIYKKVSKIYDLAGNEISKVYDTAGNLVFLSGPNETERLTFKLWSSSVQGEQYREKTVEAGSSYSVSKSTDYCPLCQYISSDYPLIKLKDYKGWHLRGNITLRYYTYGNTKVGAKLGLTNKRYGTQTGTFEFVELLDLGTTTGQSKAVQVDYTLPDMSSYDEYYLAVKYIFYSVNWTNNTGSTRKVHQGVEVYGYLGSDKGDIKLYRT